MMRSAIKNADSNTRNLGLEGCISINSMPDASKSAKKTITTKLIYNKHVSAMDSLKTAIIYDSKIKFGGKSPTSLRPN